MNKVGTSTLSLLSAAAFVLMPASSALAASAAEPATEAAPVKAELLADASAVVPGKPFKAAVLFHIAPEFHIYWKNPGDAGLATSVEFVLPEGFTASALQWPLPTQFVQPGNVVGYGYENSLMLTADVTPPVNLEAGKDVAIRAKVSWLSCRKVCIPGKTDLTAKLPVAKQSDPANEKLFADWDAQMPQPSGPAAGGPAHVGVGVGRGPTDKIIMVVWRTRPQNVEFFPAPPDDVLVENVAVKAAGIITTITFAARRTGPTGPAEKMECVVAYTLADGTRKGFAATVPLPAPGAPPAAK